MSVVIQVDKLSKQYRLGTIGGKRLVDDVNRWWAKLRGRPDPLSKVGTDHRPQTTDHGKQKAEVRHQKSDVRNPSTLTSDLRPLNSGNPTSASPELTSDLRPLTSGSQTSDLRPLTSGPSAPADVLWALKDVSFEVKQGEVLGIIGRNGAGKSTLLKILSRVTAPTSGEVRVKGRIASLLEVGTGFHPELTGRENIFLNGAILGMTKTEILSIFDEIVAFSGVEKFIDTPVKRYSSGMTVRLAFAVAAHLEPEILIIDEVLAVGDAEFQKKCLGRMRDVAGEGRTVLFVSHNMGAVENLCAKTLLLTSGELVLEGLTSKVIHHYLEANEQDILSAWKRPKGFQSAPLEIKSVSAILKGDQPTHILDLEIECVSVTSHKPAFIVLDVLDESERAIMQIIPKESPFMKQEHAVHLLKIEASLPPLIPGRYRLSAWVGSNHDAGLDQVPVCIAFDVTSFPDSNRTFPYVRSHGSIIASSSLTYSNGLPPRQFS